jgi:hypothetical protein
MFEHQSSTSDQIDDVTLAQMKIVERVVRPLRANSARKRKMRDELLAHLSAIYDEELARRNDPLEAVAAAGERFGNPAILTAELQATVPRRECWEYDFESRFGWHPPETALSWMTRVAIQLGVLMLLLCALVAIAAMRELGWSYSVWLAVRPIAAAALVLPVSLFSYGICYYKTRDHFFGVFGSQKSWSRVMLWAALLNCTTVASGLIFFMISYGRFAPAAAAFYPMVVFGLIWAGSAVVFAPVFGPREIRDTTWALLDLQDGPAIAE